MPFFKDLLDSISGEARREQAEKELAAKLQISQAQLQQMQAEAELKSGPEAQKRRAQRNMWIGIGVVVFLLVAGYLLYQRRISIPKVST